MFRVHLFPQCSVFLMEMNKRFPQGSVVYLDLVTYSVDVVGLVAGDQCPDDTGHSVHRRTDGLLWAKTALDHSPFMESKGGVIDAGDLRTKVEHSSFLVIASCSQPCFLERSSVFDPLGTTSPLSGQSLARIKSGDSPRAQHQSGGRNYRNPWDAVEQPALSRRRDAFWARFFDFRLRLLCVSDQDLIYVTQPLLQQVELINQKNQCRPV